MTSLWDRRGCVIASTSVQTKQQRLDSPAPAAPSSEYGNHLSAKAGSSVKVSTPGDRARRLLFTAFPSVVSHNALRAVNLYRNTPYGHVSATGGDTWKSNGSNRRRVRSSPPL